MAAVLTATAKTMMVLHRVTALHRAMMLTVTALRATAQQTAMARQTATCLLYTSPSPRDSTSS
eukprot:5388865-Prorocentrum_lima.AAC.1